jgi:hypothetical protein
MVEQLAAILRLKQNLREAAVHMVDEAGAHPDNAPKYLRLARHCRQVEREIDIAAKWILDTTKSEGTG